MQLFSAHNAWFILLGLACALPTLAVITPRAWWQRANFLAIGSVCLLALTYGQLLMLAQARWFPSATLTSAANLAQNKPQHALQADQENTLATSAFSNADKALAEHYFRAKYTLNLRSQPSTNAPRLSQIGAGELLRISGVRNGDWWQVTACPSKQVKALQAGWVNSLWLRRVEELPHISSRAQLPKCEIFKR